MNAWTTPIEQVGYNTPLDDALTVFVTTHYTPFTGVLPLTFNTHTYTSTGGFLRQHSATPHAHVVGLTTTHPVSVTLTDPRMGVGHAYPSALTDTVFGDYVVTLLPGNVIIFPAYVPYYVTTDDKNTDVVLTVHTVTMEEPT